MFVTSENVESQSVCVCGEDGHNHDHHHAEMITPSQTQMVCSCHSDKGVLMKTFDERVPDSVSGWIVHCTWSTLRRTIASVFKCQSV